jgi:hypothetical protein
MVKVGVKKLKRQMFGDGGVPCRAIHAFAWWNVL